MIRSGERAADLVAPPLFLHRFEREGKMAESANLSHGCRSTREREKMKGMKFSLSSQWIKVGFLLRVSSSNRFHKRGLAVDLKLT
jgi:hypothetical protein